MKLNAGMCEAIGSAIRNRLTAGSLDSVKMRLLSSDGTVLAIFSASNVAPAITSAPSYVDITFSGTTGVATGEAVKYEILNEGGAIDFYEDDEFAVGSSSNPVADVVIDKSTRVIESSQQISVLNPVRIIIPASRQ